MKARLLMINLDTDGGAPANCELSIQHCEAGDFLSVILCDVNVELQIPMYQLGLLLGGDEHG